MRPNLLRLLGACKEDFNATDIDEKHDFWSRHEKISVVKE